MFLLRSEQFNPPRNTVRSSNKGDYLVDLFKSDKFSYAIVEDIEKDDAFDQVIKSGNFDAIEHTASPFHVRDTKTLAKQERGLQTILYSCTQMIPTSLSDLLCEAPQTFSNRPNSSGMSTAQITVLPVPHNHLDYIAYQIKCEMRRDYFIHLHNY